MNKERYHEICLYFLIDISNTKLLEKGEKFTLTEVKQKHLFEWLPFEKLKSEYMYPLFIRDKIFDMPKELTMVTETE